MSLKPSVNLDFGRIPLYFIANQGQMDERVAYYVQGKDKTIYFTQEGLTFVLANQESSKQDRTVDTRRGLSQKTNLRDMLDKNAINEPQTSQRWVVKLDFPGANPDVHPVGEEKTEAAISYFKGKPEAWKSGMSTYSKVVYANLWPGIDLVYSGAKNALKYEFVVRPGADPGKIRLAYRGASEVKANKEGQLEVTTPFGGFQDDRPVAYQEVGGKRTEVGVSYEVKEEYSCYAYGFRVGKYDLSWPLILDPAVLIYCGFIGGSDDEESFGIGDIAVDSSGCAYVTGDTSSTQSSFPVTVGPDLTYNGDQSDAFVAKVKADGTGLVYCGYIGGHWDDSGSGITVDSAGNAYVTGCTDSDQTSFPVKVGPDLTFNGGYTDAFVAKISSSPMKNDFNGDGQEDILWRYNGSGGKNALWYMKGATKIGYADVPAVTDLNWKIENH